ncbi:MAG TPA: GntR family transcriptional regulator [Acidimicrobiales bacterium]
MAEQLRRAIVAGDLAPGQVLPTERELTVEFGVSRTTVREALRALQAQGLLRSGGSAPFRSVVSGVSSLLGGAYEQLLSGDQITLLDLVQFRGMLEIAAIERAVLDRTAHQLTDVRAAATRVGVVATEELFAAYLDFHMALVRSSGNQALLLTMEAVQGAMREHLSDAVRDVMASPHRGWTAARLSEVYTGIVEALEARDSERAGELLLAHMTDFYNELLSAQVNATHE